MGYRADGLEFRPVGGRKTVDVEPRGAGPNGRKNTTAATHDPRAAHYGVADQHRTRRRARHRVDLGGPRRPRSGALRKTSLAQDRGRQLDHDIDTGADVESLVILGKVLELFVMQSEDANWLGMMDDSRACDPTFKVQPDEED